MAETTRQLEVLGLLSPNSFVSGQQLAQQLSLSRTAVWQAIKTLRSWGIRVDAVKGRGYCLRKELQLLNAEIIRNQFSQSVGDRVNSVDCALVVESTNQSVRELGSIAPHDTVVALAEMQTAGRGRRGRQWCSPFAANLYLSIRTRLQLNLGNASALGLHLCLAAAERLQQIGLQNVKVKWPNDLYCQNSKLAGFLLEMFGVVDTEVELIIGFGLNVDMRNVDGFTDTIDQPFTDMISHMSKPLPERSVLAGQLIDAFVNTLLQYQQQNLPELPKRWARFDLMANKPVVLSNEQLRVEGVARGVDLHGRLRLENNAGMQTFTSGDLSARLS